MKQKIYAPIINFSPFFTTFEHRKLLQKTHFRFVFAGNQRFHDNKSTKKDKYYLI
ncbi:MAG: hypothetical protein NWQ46_08635 [Spirosomaceae bacterium]|nr:hypothetical protein [Spirosomataceae bacterium]